MQEGRRSTIAFHGQAIGFLLAVWLVVVAFTVPVGAFPLNDDWNYAWTVRALLEDHRLLITQWSLAASLTHSLTGFLFCLPFGFTFEALRVSGVFMAFLAVAMTYVICYRLSGSRMLSVLLSMTLLINPLFINLSLTFMTDVPFLAWAGVMVVLLMPLMRRDVVAPAGSVAIACAASVAACLLRQTGLVVPLSFALGTILDRKQSSRDGEDSREVSYRRRVITILLPLVFALAAVIVFQVWLARTVGELFSYKTEHAYLKEQLSQGAAVVFLNAAQSSFVILIYLGLFILPLIPVITPLFLRVLEKSERKFAMLLWAQVTIMLACGLVMKNGYMPLVDNIFFNLGLGPLLLGGPPESVVWPSIPHEFMLLLSVAGTPGAGLLFSLLTVLLLRTKKRQRLFFDEETAAVAGSMIAALLIYTSIICVRGFFDRYLLFSLFLLLPILAATSRLQPAEEGRDEQAPASAASPAAPALAPAPLPALPAAVAVGLMLPFALYGILGTHDYFSWNRARWQAAGELMEKRAVSAMDIDGGLEFNGWHAYDKRYRDKAVVYNPNMTHNNLYAITLSPLNNYVEIGSYEFQRWLPPGTGKILVLRKIDANSVGNVERASAGHVKDTTGTSVEGVSPGHVDRDSTSGSP